MIKYIRVVMMLACAWALPSCATIINDSRNEVSIKSNVEDVDVKITNLAGETVLEGKTPLVATLKTSRPGYFSPEKYKITATKDGYIPLDANIDWHVSKWYAFGNLVFGGLIGYLIVDPITGNMYYLDDSIDLIMAPESN